MNDPKNGRHSWNRKEFWSAGLGFLAVAVILFIGIRQNGFQDFIEGYFFIVLFVMAIPVGSLGVRLVHDLTGGRWGEVIRNGILITNRTIPLTAVLWLPVFFWLDRIYIWINPSGVSFDSSFEHKMLYLNVPFFILRSVFYLAFWTWLIFWLNRQRKKNWSGLFLVLYILICTFSAIDWVMSLVPQWYSTIFGLMFVTGQVLQAFCFTVMMVGLKERTRSTEAGPFIDLGNLMLTMLLLWAYLTFSQFLIIWMGNMPDEISWYLAGIRHGGAFMPFVLIFGHFLIPFFLLLRRSWKSRPMFLAGVGIWIIIMKFFDIGWMVFPGLREGDHSLTLTHLGAVLLVIGIYLIGWRISMQTYMQKLNST